MLRALKNAAEFIWVKATNAWWSTKRLRFLRSQPPIIAVNTHAINKDRQKALVRDATAVLRNRLTENDSFQQSQSRHVGWHDEKDRVANNERDTVISKRKAEIIAVGTAEFPRYIIMEDADAPPEQRRYWAGQKWIKQARIALLYANRDLASHDLAAVSEI